MKENIVAIVSCYFQHNFGSQLQAYATQLMLENIKVANVTICIDGLKNDIRKAKLRYFLSRMGDINTIKDKMGTLKKIGKKTIDKSFRQNMDVRFRCFEDFSHKMFNLSENFNSLVQLHDQSRRFGAFVVGSDQLWLPSNIAANYYTLNFVPDDVPKISFATSFGVSKLPSKQSVLASVFLNRLDFCSVREVSGKNLVKSLTGRNVPVVCDPTLMLSANQWQENISADRVIKDKYLFCYFLGNNPVQRKFVEKFKKETGYKIVQLQHCDEFIKSDEMFADFTPYDIGPFEFLRLIRDAEYVFTDSFHATVFSLLFHKCFFSFRRYKKDSSVSTNGRLYSLLTLVKLENRLLNGDECIPDCMDGRIDFNAVDESISILRKSSNEYIVNALKSSGINCD